MARHGEQRLAQPMVFQETALQRHAHYAICVHSWFFCFLENNSGWADRDSLTTFPETLSAGRSKIEPGGGLLGRSMAKLVQAAYVIDGVPTGLTPRCG
jgi:hypothetical protein